MWSTINWFESLDISLLSQQKGHNWTPRKMLLVMSKVGGGKKPQDNGSFYKVTPLIWAIEDQNNESSRGGFGP